MEGDCGITVFMLFDTREEAVKFEECLKAEGITGALTSACRNLIPAYPVASKSLFMTRCRLSEKVLTVSILYMIINAALTQTA